ncbi:16S rRNA m(7)G-527 methyltransferase [Pilibacter termitis]|uniref:Ribosomal RNA small subunit methyltransferase G n=1 Tax=Pilibacter termitis TaxID=263852 RepID=A0A1T4RE76_9ENTE|nr:16S rRNA (guanine(527)-N(7))-methyltransferase RsmG [Pilibacter termitis]SKA14209.1 16S rRNA m(7)G-527 methyltransferase [Pilibacter termitis]
MNPEQFVSYIAEKGIELTEKQQRQFEDYFHLLVEWNEKMNLTAITEESEVYLKHFVDSLEPLLRHFVENKPIRLVDVGAGAGFPSVPMKILAPNIQLTIVDSLNKRITFLTELAKKLELEQVQFVHARAEDFGQDKKFREQFDLVVARAVARMSVLSELCLPLAKKGGKFIALKASKSEEELQEAKKAIATLGGKLGKIEQYNLATTNEQRTIIEIEKRKETPNKYPRKAGLPNKKPIV